MYGKMSLGKVCNMCPFCRLPMLIRTMKALKKSKTRIPEFLCDWIKHYIPCNQCLGEYASETFVSHAEHQAQTSGNQESHPIFDVSSCTTLTKPLKFFFSFCKTIRERTLAQNSSLDLGNVQISIIYLPFNVISDPQSLIHNLKIQKGSENQKDFVTDLVPKPVLS